MRAFWTRYYPWIIVVFLIVLYSLSFVDRVTLSLLVGPIRKDLAISDTQFSVLAGFAFAIMYAVAGMPMGWIADHRSRRIVIAVGCALWSLMTALCGVVNGFWALFGARVGVGIGEATLTPAAYSLLSDLFPREKLARALSFYLIGIPLGSGLALLIGGSVVAAASHLTLEFPILGTPRPWQAVFLAIGLPGLLLAAATLFVIKEPPRKKIQIGAIDQDLPSISTTAAFLWQRRDIYSLLIGGVSCASLFSYAASTWIPATLIRVHGFSAGHAGMFLGTSIIVLGIPGCITSGAIADSLIKRGRVDGHIIVAKIYCVGIAICGVLGPIVPWRGLSLTLIAALGFFSFTWSGVPSAFLQIITPNRMRGQTSAIYIFAISVIGLGLGPTMVGLTTDHIFGHDNAVGKSLALVGAVFLGLALVQFQMLGHRVAVQLKTSDPRSAYLRNLETDKVT
jgi:MFS family permease